MRRQSRSAAIMAINVEAGVTKRMKLNSQCINHIRISGNHRWTVLDYKTGPGDEPRYRRQIAFYGEIIRKTTAAPVRLVVLEIA